MDPNLSMIFTFVLMMATLALSAGYIIYRRVAQHEERKLELEARIEEAKAAQRTAHDTTDKKFEERLRVLERIATDGNSVLASQIEDLRRLDTLDARRIGKETVL